MSASAIRPEPSAQDPEPVPIISVRGVVNRFGDQVVHDGVDLDVYPGEVLGIVGGSGSGKSVLLRTMLGLHRPNDGPGARRGRRHHENAGGRSCWRSSGAMASRFSTGRCSARCRSRRTCSCRLREYFDASPEALAPLTELRLRMVGLPLDAGDEAAFAAVGRHGQARRAGAGARARPNAVVSRRADGRSRSHFGRGVRRAGCYTCTRACI